MFVMSRSSALVSIDGYQTVSAPRSLICIAFPSFCNANTQADQKNKVVRKTSREEIQSLFSDELRSPFKPQ